MSNQEISAIQTQAPQPLAPIKVDDPLKEWAECRSTIARFDTIQEDLRKFGFSLITVLLTASAFFGSSKPSTDATEARVAATLSIMVLIGALFSIDTYYEAVKSGAAERALDLEARTTPPIRITKRISTYVARTGVYYVALGFYLLLLCTASGLGLWASLLAHAYPAAAIVGGLGFALLAYMVVYWFYVRHQSHFDREKRSRRWPDDMAFGQ